jgi:MFS transporter, FSR family, fosmidomycin resistance protein
MLVDMWGKKGQLMALSLFWVGFPYLLMGFTTTYWMLLVCVMLVGIGNNLWHPTAIPLLGRMFPTRKGLALSLHGMGGNVGDALAPLAVGALLTTLSWRENCGDQRIARCGDVGVDFVFPRCHDLCPEGRSEDFI